jgi:hypothetical protein
MGLTNYDVPIFTVTVVRHLTMVGGMRAVGYAHTYQDAALMVTNNDCDISEEGYYRHAVVEKIVPGFYMYPRKEYWWRWDPKDQKYYPCEKPEKYKQVAGFGLG